jgi:23S rRNA (cytidine2498-2'-O)-methyltransferase
VHYILCKDDNWTSVLKSEITADFTKKCVVTEGYPLIKIDDDISLKNSYIAFSTTALINATVISDNSVSIQTKDIMNTLSPLLNDCNKINFHIYAMTKKYGILETGRADIFKGKVLAALKKKNITTLRKGFDRKIPFLQVLILPDRSIAMSYLNKEEVREHHSLISPFVGGFNNVEEDKKAPSRAFKKIIEAQEILGVKISDDESVVDLGACPGGWTYIARKNGAKVVALDRSPLNEELMIDDHVTFLKEDAFKFEVDNVIDWAISDIICAPERILELIEYWVIGKKCRNFVFTIKFQGQSDYGILKKFKVIANKTDYDVILKQLNANKNEVTIMGTTTDLKG